MASVAVPSRTAHPFASAFHDLVEQVDLFTRQRAVSEGQDVHGGHCLPRRARLSVSSGIASSFASFFASLADLGLRQGAAEAYSPAVDADELVCGVASNPAS